MHIVIVTGLPASGKSTRARELQKKLGYDLISRDAFKEALADERGCGSLEESRALGAKSWEMLWAAIADYLQQGRPLIVDADFKGEKHAKRFWSLPGIEAYEVEQILCSAGPDILFERFKKRVESGERHFCHFDHERLDHMKQYYPNAKSVDCRI